MVDLKLNIPMSGEGNGTPLQYSCLQNPMDGGAWWAKVHVVAKSRTQLSDFTVTFTLLYTTYFMLTLLCFKLNLFFPITPFYVWISTQWEVNF